MRKTPSEMEKAPVDSRLENKFDSAHREILSRYQNELPHLSIHPDTILVVPSLSELSNNNFWRLLRSLALQQDIDQDQFATLIIINNSVQAVRFALNEVSGDDPAGLGTSRFEGTEGDLLAQRYKENQVHLGILRLFNETKSALANTLPEDKEKIIAFSLENLKNSLPDISNHELNIFCLALRRGVNIFGVDCSSRDKALDLTNKKMHPIGIARNIGGHIAWEFLQKNGSPNSLIDFLDGDAFPSYNYFKEMSDLAAVVNGGYVQKPLLPEVVEIPERIQNINDKYEKFASLVRYLVSSISESRGRYWPNSESDTLGGPQVAVSPALFRSVGGYSIFDANTDFTFSNLLSKYGRCVPVVKSLVHLSDRERVGSVDGSGRGKIIGEGKQVHALSEARGLNEGSAKNTLYLLLKDNQRLVEMYGDRYIRFRAELFKKESTKRRLFVVAANKVISTVCNEYSQMDKEVDPVMGLEIALRGKINARYHDFLAHNKALLSAVATAYEIVLQGTDNIDRFIYSDRVSPISWDKSELVTVLMKQYLPEYFSMPPGEEPSYDIGVVDRLDEVNLRDYVHIYEAGYRAYADWAETGRGK